MKISQVILIVLAGLTVTISCSDNPSNISDGLPQTVGKTHVLGYIDEFETNGTTRTYADPANNYTVTWMSGDVVGIFPREGYQEPFAIPANQVGQVWAEFDGGYWAMKDGLTYNAYYPFDKANFESADSKETISVSYIGQEQTGTDCCVGPFDYTYADWKEPENGSISFNFHHLGSFLVLTLPLPATATYTSLILNADQAVIPTKGTYDLTAATPTFIPDQESLASSLTMTLNNYNGTADDEAVFYMMLPPVDLSERALTVTLTTADASCTFDLDPFVSQARKLKRLTGTPRSSTIEGTLDDWLYLASIVRVTTPGSLNTHFTSDQYSTTTELRISGNLNYSDIYFLHNFSNLELLDMNRANIVESGKENILPNLFSHDGDDYQYLEKLKTLYLPQSLVSIDYSALRGCGSLEYVKIFDNVSTTLSDRFSENKKLNEIEVTSGNTTYASYDGCLYSKDYTTLIHCPAAKTSINFHSGVTTIAQKAFYCTSLTSVNVPEGVTELGNQAFYHYFTVRSGNLTSVSLPSSLRTIGTECFSHQRINSITIPEGVETIPHSCFKGCYRLKSVTLPSTINTLGDDAFEGTALTTISVPEGPTIIPEGIFRYCTDLTYISFPSTATRIENEAIRGCFSLKEIHCKSYLSNYRRYDNVDGIKGCKVYVPNAKLSYFQNDNFWNGSPFTLIGE